MKRLSILVVALFIAACGSNYTQPSIADDIGSVSVESHSTVAQVGETMQISLSITLLDGERIDGVHDVFTHPRTGETTTINWFVSNVNYAHINNYGVFTARQKGFVTVYAQLADIERTREIAIEEPWRTSLGGPAFDETVVPNGEIVLTEDPNDPVPDPNPDPIQLPNPDPTPNPDPLACQGFAIAAVSFTGDPLTLFGGDQYPDIVLGPPEGNSSGAGGLDVLSLGFLGEIVLDVGDCEIVDGPGTDLIVFENAFFVSGDPLNPFHELAVVGVSDDGVTFHEFACDDSGYPYTGCAGWHPVYSNTSNGISPFDVANAGGDPFDLAQVPIDRARYVRIRDIHSNWGGGSTAGFDLDAIAVVNGNDDTQVTP